ncbi:MAG: amidohydrolase [Ruminococcaceae bacterium]|jgi:aminobenzoyl-glutamate utilization protein B|nr:amidohydrolase [Oscillospiraceae bacterium]
MPYLKAIDAAQPALIDIAAKMWDCPETAFNEVNACKWISEYLASQGFEVETGYVGLPTAIKATWGSGHPVIGILAEYDALPGMSQKQQATKEPVVVGAPGQACGHNLLGMASVGAVLGMKAELEEKKLSGTVVFLGCPAEEVLTGKAFMARNGAFRDLDLAFSWHGSTMNTITDADGVMTGLNSAIFHFKGRTAHAGGDPYNGRSALDAAELMSVGANYLREHVTSDVRIHYSYKEAGTAPNIVPDRASVWYYVRAMSREAIEDTYDRLVKVAKGAAMMTETEVEIEFLGGCYNTLNNHVLAETLHQAQLDVERPVWTEEEKAFAAKLNEQSPTYAAMKAAGKLDGCPICDFVNELQHNNGYGSTDVGDVMHIVPCTQIMTATCNLAAPGHSWQIAACAGNSIGFKGMIYGAKVMADAAAKIYEDPTIAERAKAEFDEAMKGKTYKCPIPMEVPVPSPRNN